MNTLFMPAESGYARASEHWCFAHDGNLECCALFRRHYSAAKNRRPKQRQFVGPGERIVLLGADGNSMFVWRKEKFRQDGQKGINCAIFRNEGAIRSSLLIREAMRLAWNRWPEERLFTMIDAAKIRCKEPGKCFQKAGWTQREETTKRGLLIFEILP